MAESFGNIDLNDWMNDEFGKKASKTNPVDLGKPQENQGKPEVNPIPDSTLLPENHLVNSSKPEENRGKPEVNQSENHLVNSSKPEITPEVNRGKPQDFLRKPMENQQGNPVEVFFKPTVNQSKPQENQGKPLENLDGGQLRNETLGLKLTSTEKSYLEAWFRSRPTPRGKILVDYLKSFE